MFGIISWEDSVRAAVDGEVAELEEMIQSVEHGAASAAKGYWDIISAYQAELKASIE